MGIIRNWQAGVTHYQKTGKLPDDYFWDKLEDSYNKNPVRFEKEHPAFAGLFEAPPKIGMLPDTPYWDNMRNRYEINASRFTYYHPFQGKMLKKEYFSIKCDDGIVKCDPTPCINKAVPEPTSIVLVASAILTYLVYKYRSIR